MTTVQLSRRYEVSAELLRLRDLIGKDRVSNLDPGHPLREGLLAIDRCLSGQTLTTRATLAMSDLGLYAREVARFESDRSGFRDDLANKLREHSECLSLLFELNVAAFVRPRVADLRWTTLGQSTPDLRAAGPNLAIECKYARSGNKATNYGPYLKDAASQHLLWEAPLVVAIGFDSELSGATLGQMAVQGERYLPWLVAHPHVSAVLIFGREPQSNDRERYLGRIGRKFRAQRVIEIRNEGATRPLPPELRFGDGGQPKRWVLPTRSTSMKDAFRIE